VQAIVHIHSWAACLLSCHRHGLSTDLPPSFARAFSFNEFSQRR
jgi:ribulose-5-phosphate 4-epimerase/fuculose-1-phosphate aldolase